MRRTTTRREALLLGGALAAAPVLRGHAQAAERVTVRLDWTPWDRSRHSIWPLRGLYARKAWM